MWITQESSIHEIERGCHNLEFDSFRLSLVLGAEVVENLTLLSVTKPKFALLWQCQLRRHRRAALAMAFIMEFVEHFIRANMEDPRELDDRNAAHIRVRMMGVDDEWDSSMRVLLDRWRREYRKDCSIWMPVNPLNRIFPTRISDTLFQETKRKADELKDLWTHPVKPYGYWSEDRSNMKLLLDLRLPSLSGRKSPYDSLPKPEGS